MHYFKTTFCMQPQKCGPPSYICMCLYGTTGGKVVWSIKVTNRHGAST